MFDGQFGKIQKLVSNYFSKYVSPLFTLAIGILLWLGITNYTTLELGQNRVDFIFQLIEINLTLFGFSLVGGIFEKYKEPKEEKAESVEIKLFQSSMNFLTSTLFLFMFIGSSFLPKETMFYSILNGLAPLFLIFAILLFCIGLINVFLDLNKYSQKFG